MHNYPMDPLKTLIDSGTMSNFISPSIVEKFKIPKSQLENPQVVQLAVLVNGHPHTIPFLVCPIGSTPAILGMTWLTAEAPLINWQQGLITFPEQVQIASKEEADLDPLADLPTQYHEFAKVFGEEEFKFLPPHREYNIAIDLIPDAKLSPGPIYSMMDAESKELATGKICPSTSSAGALVMFVKNADGSLRLVMDYQKLNDVTHKNVYPLPRQDNLMAKLRYTKIFTKLDLCRGYNNIQIKEGNKWKMAFHTKYGLFEYLVMPFGLTNAPAASQHFMNNLFQDLIDVTVVIYLDDILIFLEKPEEHPSHVREVLSRLMKNQLFCKLLKCHFHVTTVDYLGIVISPAGFSMDQKKIEAITSWPQPKTVKQIQAFLGFVNYLRQFIPNFSLVAHPCHNLTRKETPWSWGNQEEEAFQELKSLVTKSLVLIHSNPNLPYYLETDASGVAMGAILSAKANYDTHDKELLAIIKALEEWQIFLEATDRQIQVFMDHRNLEYYKIQSLLKEDPSLESIVQFLTEDANNVPPSIRRAYWDYNWEEGLLWYQGKMVVPNNEALKEQLLKEFHNSPLAGHLGQQRMLELLSCNYWWPGMKSSAKEWVECCPTCQSNRQPHAPVIALKPLEVPPFPFHTILYNFITGFPKSQGHNAILVVIDSFSKFGHFIPTSKKVSAKGLADACLETPWTTSQNRIRPSLSSAYHLESDGQTERVNQFIEFYLRSYVAADHLDWATWLPLAEYTYNNAKHASTGKTPFELVYGRNPVMNPSNVPANVPEANHVADTLAQEWKEAESALRMLKECMAGTKGSIPSYNMGEKVWLDAKNVQLCSNSNKLDPKQIGPFKIIEKISSHAYHLKLPESLKIHNVFYVGLLSKLHKSPSQPLPDCPPPKTIEGEEEYKVEQIIDSKRQHRKWFYLIKWKGYGPEDNSWEPEELLEHSQEEIRCFNKSQLKKACDSAKSL
ncbi:Retrotransposable element Tf2 protein [Rhizoctonia solani]|uniref:Retrotransposable element Tf2 protein n=1 Tax=Rhizoctonia solani TaxID=456999 RepID=A0A8H8T2M8_9AGAM|nr:Retrotransposable element Tf2 protein [Rhizoctonia solani]QRW25753.1 Retrotransposable element Tf2 protein [Rhizoctonia solani]